MTDNSMQNQIALVTGAAGGIGAAISHRLAMAGARVILVDIKDPAEIHPLVDSLPGLGHLVVKTFIDDADSCAQLAEKLAKEIGSLDLLVNCAGITTPVPQDDQARQLRATQRGIAQENVQRLKKG